MSSRSGKLFDIINDTLEDGGVELESWRIGDIVTKIEDYLDRVDGS